MSCRAATSVRPVPVTPRQVAANDPVNRRRLVTPAAASVDGASRTAGTPAGRGRGGKRTGRGGVSVATGDGVSVVISTSGVGSYPTLVRGRRPIQPPAA